ncbi:MAG: phosphoglucosamine mutase [bacterium JZ-2024 1]
MKNSPHPLFGTDGVRGVANSDLSPEMVLFLGMAFGTWLVEEGFSRATVVVGNDSRISSDMLTSALCAGIASTGTDVLNVGIIPTPAISHFLLQGLAQGGAVVSASHNPVEDNGIKFFQPSGEKLTDEQEKRIEEIFRNQSWKRASSVQVGKIYHHPEWKEKYIEFLLNCVEVPHGEKKKMRIVLDCAYGATSVVAPEVFRRLGQDTVSLHDNPDGLRINVGCGSTFPQVIAQKTVEHSAFLGVSFDGDGDRVIFSAEDGTILDGDNILVSMTKRLSRRWLQEGWAPVIVGTSYTNSAVERVLSEMGYRLYRAPPGDKNVFLCMKEEHSPLGGETSGHIVFSQYSRTGDGILTALLCLIQMIKSNQLSSQWAKEVEKLPQVLVAIPLQENKKYEILNDQTFSSLVQKEKERLLRLFIRPSGTENVLRILIEAENWATAYESLKVLTSYIARWEGRY